MSKNFLPLILILIFISLSSLAYSEDYIWLESSDGIPMTNNPSPTPWVKYSPNTYEPIKLQDSEILDEQYTYLRTGGTNLVVGEEFNEVTSNIDGSYITWYYGFSKDIPTGRYTFSTKAADVYGNIFEFTSEIIIDVTPPLIGPLSGANGLIFQGQTETNTIETGNDVTIAAQVTDLDGTVDILPDTVVIRVRANIYRKDEQDNYNKILNNVELTEAVPNSNIYGVIVPYSALGDGEYKVEIKAYDSLSDPVQETGNINTLEVTFRIMDTIPPGKPIVWWPPEDVREHQSIFYTKKGDPTDKVTLIGYIGEVGNVKAELYQLNQELMTSYIDTIQSGSPLQTTSTLHNRPDILNYEKGDKVIIIDAPEGPGILSVNNYVIFYNHNRTNFARYGIVDVSDASSGRVQLTLDPGLEQDVQVDESSYVYLTIQPKPMGYFEMALELYEGVNELTLTSYDLSTNPSEELKQPDLPLLVRDSTPPKLTLETPKDGITNQDMTSVKIKLEGTNSLLDKSSIILKIDNNLKCIYKEDGTSDEPGCIDLSCNSGDEVCFLVFEADAPYSEDFHKASITAADIAGNLLENELIFEVNKKIPSSPDIIFTSSAYILDLNIFGEEKDIYVVGSSNTQARVEFLEVEEVEVVSTEMNRIDKITGNPIGGTKEEIQLQFISTSIYEYNFENLVDSIYKLNITARRKIEGTEDYGPEYIFEGIFVVDTGIPEVSVGSSFPSQTSTATVEISGKCSDDLAPGEKITIITGEKDFEFNSVLCFEGSFSQTIILSQGDGDKTIKVTAKDWVNNTKTIEETIMLDTGIPEIQITNLLNNEDIIFGNSPYKTNNDFVTILGTYSDTNFKDIVVSINPPLRDYSLDIDRVNEEFELNLTLIKQQDKEIEYEVVVVASDAVGLEASDTINITADLKGPTIASFIPETGTTYQTQPTLGITTNEYSNWCRINYSQHTPEGYQQDNFYTTNNYQFTVSLSEQIKHVAGSTYTQNVYITCGDQLDNIVENTQQLIIDLVNPQIESFDLDYLFKVPDPLAFNDTVKRFFIGFIPNEETQTEIRLSASTNEDTRCTYNTYNGDTYQFENYNAYSKSATTAEITVSDGNDYTYYIICEDKGGLQTEAKTIIVTVDTQSGAEGIQIAHQSPPTSDAILGSKIVTFSGSVISLIAQATLTGAKLEINGVNETLILTTSQISNVKTYSKDKTFTNDGIYNFIIWAENSEGLVASISGQFEIDTTAPSSPGVIIGDPDDPPLDPPPEPPPEEPPTTPTDPPPPVPEGQATLILNPPTTTTSNTQFSIQVVVSDVVGLYSAPFHLTYDPSIVVIDSVIDGNLLTDALLVSNGLNTGELIIGYSRSPNTINIGPITIPGRTEGVNGSGNLLTINFNKVAVGNTELNFINVNFADSLSQSINITSVDGSATLS
ncbi:MAG: cohesin domain-containing protein [Nanoarchaeota archaeon]|nr:cohesin domain-containing protein [Nanoarchaeota archaeon]